MIPSDFLQFLSKTQHLKSILRHSWTDDIKRQESVAEHSWHMTIMAMALEPYLKNRVDLFRVLKLISFHDLGEVVGGDIPAFQINEAKYENEKKAVKETVGPLSVEKQEEILGLWEEYEKRQTREAVFVKMLDVLDVIFQHLVADIATWVEIEFTFNIDRASEKYFKEEPFMMEVYDLILNKLSEKIRALKLSETK